MMLELYHASHVMKVVNLVQIQKTVCYVNKICTIIRKNNNVSHALGDVLLARTHKHVNHANLDLSYQTALVYLAL